MKTIKQLLLFTLPLMLLAGCSKDEPGGHGSGSPVAVQFSSGTVALSRTSTTTTGETHWKQGDQIGIFMIGNGTTSISGNIKENADNVEYKANTGDGNQSSFSPAGSPIYYPHGGDKVDFIAYYPYTAPLTNYTYPVDVSNQSDPEEIDVLYSNNSHGHGKGSSPVDLELTHALSKLEVNVQAGAGSPSLAGLSITIGGRYQKANLSLSDGSTLTDPATGDIVMREVTPGARYQAILIPQNR